MIKTPVNQIRLTNVAIVRLKKGGKRFELACYKNKVANWRNKVESNLNEVLQIDEIFTNVSKGAVASHQELKASFGKDFEKEKIIAEILDSGDLQVSELEREDQLESVKSDIMHLVSKMCVNSETGKPWLRRKSMYRPPSRLRSRPSM